MLYNRRFVNVAAIDTVSPDVPADMLQGWLQSPLGEFVAILVRIAQVPDGIAQIPV